MRFQLSIRVDWLRFPEDLITVSRGRNPCSIEDFAGCPSPPAARTARHNRRAARSPPMRKWPDSRGSVDEKRNPNAQRIDNSSEAIKSFRPRNVGVCAPTGCGIAVALRPPNKIGPHEKHGKRCGVPPGQCVGSDIMAAKTKQASVQQRAISQFRALAAPYRFRVQADSEGFPVISGRHGQIEWFDGRDLAVYANRPRLFAKLWAIPGMTRHQSGETEMRAVFPPALLDQVARVIKARRKRTLVPEEARRRGFKPTHSATSESGRSPEA